MTDAIRVRRALISVSDKTGLIDLARALKRDRGVELLSTGGISQSNVETQVWMCVDVADAHGLSGNDGWAGQDTPPGGSWRLAGAARQCETHKNSDG